MDTIKIIRDASGALRFEHPYIFQKPTAVTIGTFDGVHLVEHIHHHLLYKVIRIQLR